MRNVTELRLELADAIQDMRKGDKSKEKLSHEQLKAMVQATNSMIASIKVELQYNKDRRYDKKIDFIEQ